MPKKQFFSFFEKKVLTFVSYLDIIIKRSEEESKNPCLERIYMCESH